MHIFSFATTICQLAPRLASDVSEQDKPSTFRVSWVATYHIPLTLGTKVFDAQDTMSFGPS